MSAPTLKQYQAIALVLAAVIDAVKAAGPTGAPGGILYAGLMSQGCTLNQFQGLMGMLVKMGKLRQEGDLYFAVESA